MEQSGYIAEGIKAKGSLAALARHLDQGEAAMRDARNQKRGLPIYACISLAQLIDVDPLEIIAASELVTEKRPERRAVFLPFVQAGRAIQHLTIAGFAAGLIAMASKIIEVASLNT